MSAMTHAGIIAAGLGERLKEAGIPKPLVPVAGRPLAHWVAAALQQAGASSITVLLNSEGRACRQSLESAFPRIAWRFLEWDSPSSWESFRRVSSALAPGAERFLISTVDALISPRDVTRFAHNAWSRGADAALAVTAFVEDEKPLWVDVDAGGWALRAGEDARERRWVTSGLYGISRAAAQAMAERSHLRLRDYWTSLLREGARVAAVELGPCVDVDRPEDLSSAGRFIGAWRQERLCP